MKQDDAGDRLLARIGAGIIAALATAAYLYAIFKIAQVPDGDGSGFQWVALGPYTLLYVGVLALARYVGHQNRTPAERK